MRTKHYLSFLFAVSSMVLFNACENDVYSPPGEVGSTKELIAPADFDWKTTASVTYTVTSPVNTAVSFYTDKDCTDKGLLAEGVVIKANEPAKVTLEIPTYKTSVYVQYPTADGTAVMETATDAVTRAKDKNIILPDIKDFEYDNQKGFIHYYYPSKGEKGTLMFEDLYPHTGDYDFNDFVIAYNVDVFTSNGNKGESRDGFTMTFQIRAIGGTMPYRPALRLKGWKVKNLEDAQIKIESTRSDISMALVKDRGDNEDVIFVFTGTDNLRKDGFYNTRPDKIDNDFPTITCSVIKDNWNLPLSSSAYAGLAYSLPTYFDFFIQNTDNNNEIHFKGFGPTDMSPQDPNTEFVQKHKNLVWAIAVPQLIAHPQEAVDILDVYPAFQGWVSSGGGHGKNEWYTKKPHDKVIALD